MTLKLKMSADTKTSSVVKRRPKKYEAVHNAFGKKAGPQWSCGTWATDACWSACYTVKAERYKAVTDLLINNTEYVIEFATAEGWPVLADAYEEMLLQSEAKQRKYGITNPLFRWDWSGEVINEYEAMAIAEAHRRVPTIAGWIYLRNLLAVSELVGVPTLRVLISADKDNIKAAESIALMYDLQVAYMEDGAERAAIRKLIPTLTCPASKKGNVVKSRKSPTGLAGICAVCRACVDNDYKPDINFPIH